MVGFIFFGSQHLYDLSGVFLFLGIFSIFPNEIIIYIRQYKEDKKVQDKLARGELSREQGDEIDSIKVKMTAILAMLAFVVAIMKLLLRK